MATLNELQNRLIEAETALHNLMTGVSEVSITYQGRSVTYSQINLSSLEAYIGRLNSQISVTSGRRGRAGSYGVKF